MKLSIEKYFSKILARNFDHYEGFSQNYQWPSPFTAIPSICNQRSLANLMYHICTIQYLIWLFSTTKLGCDCGLGPNGYIMGHSDGTAGASAVRSRRGVDPHGRSPHGQIGCDSLQRFHLQTLGLPRTESPFRIRIPGTYGHRHLCRVQPKRGWSSRVFLNFLCIYLCTFVLKVQIF